MMNIRTEIVDSIEEVDGKIINVETLIFADDWMPQDVSLLSANELANRLAGARALNGKLIVTVETPPTDPEDLTEEAARNS